MFSVSPLTQLTTMEPFQVLMVGPTGVGKTSTLASMSDELQKEVHKLQYHTTIPDELIAILNEFTKTSDKNDFEAEHLPLAEKGTAKETSYSLDFFSQNNEKDMTVNFIDVPGNYFIPPNAFYDEMKQRLKDSVASMWCVDCVSMIEGRNDPNYDYHTDVNAPKFITEFYKNLDSIKPGHRLIFVLMRTETYLNNKNQGAEWLLKKFDEFYSQYIKEIRERFTNENIEIFVASVQTLGCFKFKSWQRQPNGGIKATYVKFTPPGHYSPDNCATPALLAIDKALHETVKCYEEKKNYIYNYFKNNYRGSILRIVYRITHCFGDRDKANRIADIFELLKDGKPISSSEYPKECKQFNGDINAHIVLERLKKAADTMDRSVEQKLRDDKVKRL